jgi:hypothetical protein
MVRYDAEPVWVEKAVSESGQPNADEERSGPNNDACACASLPLCRGRDGSYWILEFPHRLEWHRQIVIGGSIESFPAGVVVLCPKRRGKRLPPVLTGSP